MTPDQFFQKYNGKGIDFDGAYGFQCMDVYQQYNKEVIGGPHLPANAYQVWNYYPRDLYERIDNNATNFPQKGDVVIWDQNTGGGFGHIAICTDARPNDFNSFEQNWPAGSKCHFQPHNYQHVLGWLHPKNLTAIVVDDMPPYFKTLLQENGLDLANESQIRTFFQKAKDFDGKATDLASAQKLLEQTNVLLDKAQTDLVKCNTDLKEALLAEKPVVTGEVTVSNGTDEEKLSFLSGLIGAIIRFFSRR